MENMGNEAKPHLLLVDDELSSMVILERVLSKDFVVSMTTQPEEVEKMVENNNISVILTDYSMPKLDGVELTRRLMIKYPYLGIIIISSTIEDIAVEAIDSGAFDYVTKPVTIKVLRHRLNHLQEVLKLKNRGTKIIRRDSRDSEEIPLYKDAKEKFEFDYLTRVLTTCKGNINKVTKITGQNRQDIYNRIKRFKINLVDFRGNE